MTSAWIVALLSCLACGSGPERPNVLLLTVDTLRADRLGCYGEPSNAGPVLCSVADTGIRYVWAFSAAPSTAPAIASLHTSTYPSRHGVTQFASTSLPNMARTLAEEFRAAGYDTAAVVSNPVLGPSRNIGQGFDLYDTEMTRTERNRAGFMEREAEATTDTAFRWLSGASEPWFLWVHYQDPHGPYEPPGAPRAADAAGAKRLPRLADHSGYRGIPAYQLLSGAFAPGTYEARYLDEIAYLDAEIARLLERVDADERLPAIAVSSDHGEAFGEDDYWFAHGHSVGVEQVRVPLLWRPPGGGRAAVVHAPVSTLDIAPTLLVAVGLPVPASFQGVVLPRTDDASDASRVLFLEHRMRAGVVAGAHYYARDRSVLHGPMRDRITGGLLRPLPARTARLAPGGAVGRYRPSAAGGAGEAAAQALAPVLDRFVSATGSPPEVDREPLPEQTRQQLEALGYLE